MGWIPARADTETDVASFIPTSGMIPLDQASPAVGIAGTTQSPGVSPNWLAIAYAAPRPWLPRRARASGRPRCSGAGSPLVDQLAHRPEELRVQFPAPDARQPASVPGQPVGCLNRQCVATVFTTDGYRDYRDDPHDHPAEED